MKLKQNKLLLPVNGKTVPEHLIDLFKKYGVKDLIFSLGFEAEKIKEYYGDGSQYGVNITYVEEKKPLGSAGAIKLAMEDTDELFFVTNGDELKDVNLQEMFEFHNNNHATVTVALTLVDDPSQYGVAIVEDNKISEFIEKPIKSPSNLINSGLSIWNQEAIDLIPEGFSMYEKAVFPKLAEQGKLYGYMVNGQWFDIGTKERYETAIKEWRGIS